MSDTIKIEVSKQDLINMICGSSPDFSEFEKLENYGKYIDNRGFDWYSYKLDKLSEEELLKLYREFKKLWILKDQ